MKKRAYTGLNIQWPISQLILSGKKTVETRTYPLPSHYLGKELALIETPGSRGKFKSRARAIISIVECFLYKCEEDFYFDFDRHCVTPDSPWRWREERPKWGWEVELREVFIRPIVITKRKGIIYTMDISLS